MSWLLERSSNERLATLTIGFGDSHISTFESNLGSRGRETESCGFLARVSERRLLGNWLDSTNLILLLVTVRSCRWLHLDGQSGV